MDVLHTQLNPFLWSKTPLRKELFLSPRPQATVKDTEAAGAWMCRSRGWRLSLHTTVPLSASVSLHSESLDLHELHPLWVILHLSESCICLTLSLHILPSSVSLPTKAGASTCLCVCLRLPPWCSRACSWLSSNPALPRASIWLWINFSCGSFL